jgi:hypothetical protein
MPQFVPVGGIVPELQPEGWSRFHPWGYGLYDDVPGNETIWFGGGRGGGGESHGKVCATAPAQTGCVDY